MSAVEARFYVRRKLGASLLVLMLLLSTVIFVSAAPEEVEADVHTRLRTLAPGGGYVFAPIHDIQPDVPPENVVGMYDAALRWGRYPIE